MRAGRLCGDVCFVYTGPNRHGLQDTWTRTEADRFLDKPVRVCMHGEGIESSIAIAAAGGKGGTALVHNQQSRTALALLPRDESTLVIPTGWVRVVRFCFLMQ
jgi:hypothetical protein